MAPEVAVMVPRPRPEEIAQWTVLVMFCVLPSEKVPVVVYWSAEPSRLTMMEFAGVTAMDCRTALRTVTGSVPVMPLVVARALRAPVVTQVARPMELTTPMAGDCDDQVVVAVRSWVEPSK